MKREETRGRREKRLREERKGMMRGEIMEKSCSRILEDESCRKNRGNGVMEEGIMEEQPCRKSCGVAIME